LLDITGRIIPMPSVLIIPSTAISFKDIRQDFTHSFCTNTQQQEYQTDLQTIKNIHHPHKVGIISFRKSVLSLKQRYFRGFCEGQKPTVP
jgi:hypothetical protein